MPTSTDLLVEDLAEACVNEMGDVFWDFDPTRDAAGQYTDPRNVAVQAVAKTLREFAEQIDTSEIYPSSLRQEYSMLLTKLPGTASDREIVSALSLESAWTNEGAVVIVRLARRYGWSILRNALALAEAMEIEDGDAGL